MKEPDLEFQKTKYHAGFEHVLLISDRVFWNLDPNSIRTCYLDLVLENKSKSDLVWIQNPILYISAGAIIYF